MCSTHPDVKILILCLLVRHPEENTEEKSRIQIRSRIRTTRLRIRRKISLFLCRLLSHQKNRYRTEKNNVAVRGTNQLQPLFTLFFLFYLHFQTYMESAMAVATEKVRSKRYAFPPNAFEILQFIITNHDEGRLLDVIYNRDTGINFQKLAAWTEITDLFNKVSVSGVPGSIPASSDTVESEERQMKLC
jgi:hypothetical protein